MEETKKKKLGLAILIATSVFGVFAAFLGGIFIFQRAYAGEIYPNVYFEDINLSGLSQNQAKYVIQKRHDQVLTREVTLRAGEKSIVAKLADIGLSYDIDKVVSESYQKGRASNFLLSVKSSLRIVFSKQKVSIEPIIDKAKYEAFSNLILPQLNNEMKNASLAIVNGEVTETKEAAGQTVKTDGLPQRILSLANNANVKEIKLDTLAVQPDIKSTNFGPAKTYADKILNKKITLTYESFSFTPTRPELGNWLDFSNQNGNFSASLDDSAIKSYLSNIAQNFEIQKVNRKINSLDNSVIQEGKEGKYLDKNDALNKIKSQINNLDTFNVVLVVNPEAPAEERVIPDEGLIPGRFPGAYIDIDLAQQKLCRIDGNNILACYTVSTGKASTPTPTGTRTIQDKSDRAWSAKYGLWMPWWEGMGGGFGIHELPEWPSGYKEGEAHLGTPVSHGCVRLGVGAAKEVYDWTTIGMPVYIHK